ncbi:polysaccharide lyase family 8 super-sandwich domain-containing protein [Paenibacillus sp. DMB20]|uniref:polysaccharide lyase family 8 super-sandwich domain-containing protein n=1 Tax=Paenibacillus sp. DMB20 TaxID=1642570 RepID=UPI000699870D|nr:polysaccharide lyase family 8 super-sandwich domain-containing protein [Paenibacillus sp. DMB20]
MKAYTRKISLALVVCMTFQMVLSFQPGFVNRAEASTAGTNLVPNGDFETVVYPGASSWTDRKQAEGWGVWLASGSGKVSVNEAVYASGERSVQVEHAVASRTGLSVNAKINAGTTFKLSARMKTDNVVSSGGVFVRTQYYKSISGVDGATANVKLGDGPVLAKLTGTNDWTLREAVLTVPADTRYVRIEPFFETGTGTAWFDDIRLHEWTGVSGLTLQPASVTLDKGQSFTFTPVFSPPGTSEELVWSSSNPVTASVYDGIVTAHDFGSVTITAATSNGFIRGQATVMVESAAMQAAYGQLRLKWRSKLLGGDSMDLNDPDVSAYMTALRERISNASSTGIWDLMNKAPNPDYLWSDLGTKTNTDSAKMTKGFANISDMAVAYSTEGSALYRDAQLRDDIIKALEWMYDNQYNERRAMPSGANWWDWEIGTPQALMNIIVLMYDELSEAQIDKYFKAIDRYVPDPTKRVQNANVTETGANLLDKSLVVVLRGVAGKNSSKIEQARASMAREFLYVRSGDGIYEDGSLIQHANIAYTGAYGTVLVGRIADLLYLFTSSPWEITDPNVNNVYKWVEDAFEPLIYKGAMMDAVKGRSISREKDSDHLTGRGVIRILARLSGGAPAEQSAKIKSMIKEWVLSDTTFPNYYEGMPIYEMNLIKGIVNDPSVTPRGEQVKHQNFAAMDRVVHLRPGFGFVISLFSDRISAFEFGNGENIKGWYTGMGMTNLYNGDLKQFSNQYWPTVDMYRLAGTTTDGYSPAPKAWAPYYNPKTWVGGSSIDKLYGSAGMDFSLESSTGSKLQGKKSWFMFDDEIVALGSGITSPEDRTVETIVENRQVSDAGDNAFIVNGVEQPANLGWNETLKSVKWAHLAGHVPGSDIGYYFPDSPDLQGLREAREGAWKDINTGGSADVITKNYVSLSFDHGKKPQDASYSYVILPNRDPAATEKYSENPDIEVISRNNQVHAVKERKLGWHGFNFWEAGTSAFVRAYSPASVQVRKQGDLLTVAVADPTQKQDKIVVDLLDNVVLQELKKDSTVRIIQTSPYLKLEIDTAGAQGKSHAATFRIVPPATGIQFDKEAATLNVGDTISLTAATVPSNAAALELSWTVDSGDIVRLEQNGTTGSVTALKAGTATITAASLDGAFSATCVVTVKEKSPGTPPGGGNNGTSPGDGNNGNPPAGGNNGNPPSGSGNSSSPSDGGWDSGSPSNGGSQSKGEGTVTGGASNGEGSGHSPQGEQGSKPNGGSAGQSGSETGQSPSGSAPGGTNSEISDIKGHWAEDKIKKAMDQGLATGYPDGTFKPEKPVTRAEFAVLLARGLGLKAETEMPFADDRSIPGWAKSYVAAGISHGFIAGYADNTFRASKSITRTELATMAAKALQLEEGRPDSLSFADAAGIPNWAKGWIASAVKAGLIEGRKDNRFVPDSQATRAEALVILTRILDAKPEQEKSK